MNRTKTTKPVVVGYSADYMTEYLERCTVWNDGTTEVEHASRYRNRAGKLAWRPGFARPHFHTGERASLPEAV